MTAPRIARLVVLVLLTCRFCYNIWSVYQLSEQRYAVIGIAPFIGGLIGYCLFDIVFVFLLVVFIVLGRVAKGNQKTVTN